MGEDVHAADIVLLQRGLQRGDQETGSTTVHGASDALLDGVLGPENQVVPLRRHLDGGRMDRLWSRVGDGLGDVVGVALVPWWFEGDVETRDGSTWSLQLIGGVVRCDGLPSLTGHGTAVEVLVSRCATADRAAVQRCLPSEQ